MIRAKVSLLLLITGLFFTSGCSCSAERKPQLIFKNDSAYFLGLQNLNHGKTKEAARYFEQCKKKGSKYCSRKSAEELAKLGNIRERIDSFLKLYEEYDDQDSLLLFVKEAAQAEEWGKILYYTENSDYSDFYNSIISLRLTALNKKSDSRFEKELLNWFITRKISLEHYKFYSANSEYFDVSETLGSNLIRARINIYRRNFKPAYDFFIENLETLEFVPQLLSDFGKACLSGSGDFYKNALIFDELGKKYTGREELFYINFYAARLYSKAGDYYTLAKNRFTDAMNYAPQNDQYDNALWYYLDMNLRISTEKGVQTIKAYCSHWNNPDYFDDLLNTIPPLLLSEGKWNEFYELYHTLDGYASNEAVSKFAYIYGRLVEEKIAIPVIFETTGTDAEAAFTRALTSDSAIYYRIMAASRLGLGGQSEEEVLLNNKIIEEPLVDQDCETLLLGYAAFGFPERIYPEFISFYNDGIKISFEASLKLSEFLRSCGEDKNEYYNQSLRIASRALSYCSRPITKEDLKLFFPKDFSGYIEKYSKEYGIPPENLYSLVRGESFFDPIVYSSVGAVGLCQLMTETAGDIAKKLKVSDYDLKNPETNVQFGAFYIAELYRRLDNQWLPAFFAYNAGVTRVRRWIKDSKITVKSSKKFPQDILLEMIPYEETREYGRKLVSAASMYGWLYDDKSVSQTVNSIVN